MSAKHIANFSANNTIIGPFKLEGPIVSGDVSLRLPTTDAFAGQILESLGDGTTQWATIAVSATNLYGMDDTSFLNMQPNDLMRYNGSSWLNYPQSSLYTDSVFYGTTSFRSASIQEASGTDPYLLFGVGALQYYTLGIDESDSTKFKISTNTTLTNDSETALEIDGSTGDTTIKKNLITNNSIRYTTRIESGAGPFTLTTNDYLIEISNTGSITINLPLLSSATYGIKYIIIKTGSGGNITVQSSGTDTINSGNTTSVTLSQQYSRLEIIAGPSSLWYII